MYLICFVFFFYKLIFSFSGKSIINVFRNDMLGRVLVFVWSKPICWVQKKCLIVGSKKKVKTKKVVRNQIADKNLLFEKFADTSLFFFLKKKKKRCRHVKFQK